MYLCRKSILNMRLAIVGSREICDREVLLEALKLIPSLGSVTEIVSGGAKGVDSLARDFATENNLKLTEFLPDYGRYGRGAPLQRNTEIIEYADIVLAIPVKGGSNGTRDGIRKAQSMGKRLYVYEASAPSAKPAREKKSLKIEPVKNPYKAGDKVIHSAFGSGVVSSVDGLILVVVFDSVGEKRISCTFKGLSLE